LKCSGLAKQALALKEVTTTPILQGCPHSVRVLYQEVVFESIKSMLIWAADTGYSMWHNA